MDSWLSSFVGRKQTSESSGGNSPDEECPIVDDKVSHVRRFGLRVCFQLNCVFLSAFGL